MTRPTFEVADILRAQGDRFLDRYRRFVPFCAAAPLRWAVIAMPARAAVIRLSRTTRAETGTAPSARHKHANAGWRPANANS